MKEFKLPKDVYVIVDPSHVMNEELYTQLCDNYMVDNGAIIELNDKKIVVFNTLNGEGEYVSNTHHKFLVDSGLIACIPISLCDNEMLSECEDVLSISGKVFASSDGSTLTFNEIEIYTDSSIEYDFENW